MKERKRLSKPVRILLVICGWIALVLAVIGIFIPVLPTTPFLLLSAACFSSGSQRAYDWLMNNKWFGTYIRNYREGKGIEKHHKRITLIFLWVTIGVSTIFFVSSWWIRGLLLVIAIAVSLHLHKLPVYDRGNTTRPQS